MYIHKANHNTPHAYKQPLDTFLPVCYTQPIAIQGGRTDEPQETGNHMGGVSSPQRIQPPLWMSYNPWRHSHTCMGKVATRTGHGAGRDKSGGPGGYSVVVEMQRPGERHRTNTRGMGRVNSLTA